MTKTIPIIPTTAKAPEGMSTSIEGDGMGCHAGGEKMLAAGIAPLAFQGKYPQYAWSTILSCYQRLVPFEKWYDIEDFKKGAFQDPAFVKAADLMQELAVKYFQKGALAMTHTESQMEWANGRAGMVFCGLWLKKEMEKAARDLDFMEAARLRDEMFLMQKKLEEMKK